MFVIYAKRKFLLKKQYEGIMTFGFVKNVQRL